MYLGIRYLVLSPSAVEQHVTDTKHIQ
ncbi:hypothetical protein SCARD494_11106 [Seiridium cardinale]